MGMIQKIKKSLFSSGKGKTAGKPSQSSSDSGTQIVVGKSIVMLPVASVPKPAAVKKTDNTKKNEKAAAATKAAPVQKKATPAAAGAAKGPAVVGKTVVSQPQRGSFAEAWKRRREQVAQQQVAQIQQRKAREANTANTAVTGGGIGLLNGVKKRQQEQYAQQQKAERDARNRQVKQDVLSSAANTWAVHTQVYAGKVQRAEAKIKPVYDEMTEISNRYDTDPSSITQADVDRYNTLWGQYQAMLPEYQSAWDEYSAAREKAETYARKTRAAQFVEQAYAKKELRQKEEEHTKIRKALGVGGHIADAPAAGNNTMFDIDPAEYAKAVQQGSAGASLAAQRTGEQAPKTLAAIGTAGVAGAQNTMANAMLLGENAVWALSPGAQKDAASAADHANQAAGWKGEVEQSKEKMQKAFDLTENDPLGKFLAELNYSFVQQGVAMAAGGVIGKGAGYVGRAGQMMQAAGRGQSAARLASRAAGNAAAVERISGQTLQNLARFVQKNAGLGTLATIIGSQNYREAREGGASNDQALAYGVLTAAAEIVTERLFGGNPLMDQEAGIVNRALYRTLGDRKFLHALDSVPAATFSEGLEEVIVNYLYTGAQAVTGQEAMLPTAEENLHSFALGAAMGGIGHAANASSGAVQNAVNDRRTGRELQLLGKEQEVIDKGLSLEGTKAERLARELQGRGMLPTARELGRQFRVNAQGQQLLTARQAETERTIARMAQDVGAQVVFDDMIADANGTENAANGYYQDGVLHIARTAEQPAMIVAKHELTHHLQEAAPQEYAAFRDYAMQMQDADAVASVQARYAAGGVTLTEAEAMDEIAADYAQQLLTEPEAIANLMNENPTLADRFFAALRALLQRLTGRADPHLRQAEKLWTEAYSAARGRQNAAASGLETTAEGMQLLPRAGEAAVPGLLPVAGEPRQAGLLPRAGEMQQAGLLPTAAELQDTAHAGESSGYIPGKIHGEQVQAGIQAVAEMEPVYAVRGTEFAKGEKDLITQVTEFFEANGNIVFNPQLGDIRLTHGGAKSDVAHGIGRKKAAAFAAVPRVLETGQVVDYQENWKDRKYDTAVIAAPITISGEPYIMGIVLKRTLTDNTFYLHEVQTEKEAQPFKTGTHPTGVPSGNASLILSLLHRIIEVKRNAKNRKRQFSLQGNEVLLPRAGEVREPGLLPTAAELRRADTGALQDRLQEVRKQINRLERQEERAGGLYGPDAEQLRALRPQEQDLVRQIRAQQAQARQNMLPRAGEVLPLPVQETDVNALREQLRQVRAQIAGLEEIGEYMGRLSRAETADLNALRQWEQELEQQVGKEEDRSNMTEAERIIQRGEEAAAAARPVQARKTMRQALLDLFHVGDGSRRKLGEQIDAAADRILERGYLTEGEEAQLFRDLMNAGVIVDETTSREYGPVRQALHGIELYVDEITMAELGNEWPSIRRQASENGIKLTGKRGYDAGIDQIYIGLAEQYPGAFDGRRTDGAEMLKDMIRAAELGKPERLSLMESAMREGGEDALEQQMLFLSRQLSNEVQQFADKAGFELQIRQDAIRRDARRRAAAATEREQARQRKQEQQEQRAAEQTAREQRVAEREAQEQQEDENAAPVSYAELKRAWEKKMRLERWTAAAKEGMSKRDLSMARHAAQYGIEDVDLNRADNAGQVKRYASALEEIRQEDRIIRRADQRTERQDAADRAANAIAEFATDKSLGLFYQRETMERNIRDIFGKEHQAEAEEIISTYFTPVHKAVAEGNRLKEKYRKQVKALGKLNQHEWALVQMKMENASEEADAYLRDNNLTLNEEQIAKIDHAAEVMRGIYNELYDQINAARMRNGYAPAPFRKDYAPHFVLDKPDTLLCKIRFDLGLGKDSSLTLPTDIAGLTDQFRPNQRWFGNLLQRQGEITDYDALHGFDSYIETAADIITLTDSTHNLRMLENAIRYRFSDEGVQEKIREIRANEELSAKERAEAEEKVYEDAEETMQDKVAQVRQKQSQGMAGLVTELRRYTDNLAAKKSREDRGWEDMFNRQIYHIVKNMEGRVAANMIGANVGSWLTNFIPITQAAGEVSTAHLIAGMGKAVRAMAKDDGFMDASTFLTNRYGSDRLEQTLTDKASRVAGIGMEVIDHFTAQTVVRARYEQNIAQGMDPITAMEDADDFAARLIADRSKGAMPTMFNATNPVQKVFTMFQLEVNNQLSYLFKDIPRTQAEKGAAFVAFALTKVFVGAFLYNLLYRELTGRDAALDPIGLIVQALGLTFDKENGLHQKEDWTFKKGAETLATGTVKNLPFIGGVMGGGRVPVSAALPRPGVIWNSLNSDAAAEKKQQTIGKELLRPATYLLLPFGGGAAKKAIEGAAAVSRGGNYRLNDKGEEELQFAIYDQSPLSYARNMALGKWSGKGAQAYVDNGFRGLNAAETAAFDTMRHELDEDPRAAMAAVLGLREIEGEKDSEGKTVTGSTRRNKEAYLQQSGLSEAAQTVLFFADSDCASDSVDEMRRQAVEQGVDETQVYRYLCAADMLEPDRDENGEAIEGSLRKKKAAWLETESGWSAEDQAAVYFADGDCAPDSVLERREKLAEAGIGQTDYYRYSVQAGKVEPDKDEKGNNVDGSRNKKLFDVIDGMDLSEEEKAAMYLVNVDGFDGSDGAREKYEAAKAAGVGDYDYIRFKADTGVMNGRDDSGKTVTNLKKKRILTYIDAMDLSDAEKDALYFAAGYKASTISDCPWHGGRVKTGSAAAARKETAKAAAVRNPQIQAYLARYGEPQTAAMLPRAGEQGSMLPRAGESTQRMLPRAGETVPDAAASYLRRNGGAAGNRSASGYLARYGR